MKVAIVLLGALALAAAAPEEKAVPRKLIPEILTELNCTTLVGLVVEANLTNTLSGVGPFTVFAPTNEAFAALGQATLDALGADKALLTDVLLSHVYAQKVLAANLTDNLVVDSVSGAKLRVNFYGENTNRVITINGAPVTKPDQVADNGLVHVVSKVLFPLSKNNIPDTLKADPRFSKLVEAVGVAELGTVLSEDGPFTLFAPTNDAFDALDEGVLDGLLADKAALKQVLLGHAIRGAVYSSGVAPGTVSTLDGGTAIIAQSADGSLTIDGAKIIDTDISAINGVIHVLENVIVPTEAVTTDAPATVTDAPATVTDAPATVTDAPTTVTDAPTTVVPTTSSSTTLLPLLFSTVLLPVALSILH